MIKLALLGLILLLGDTIILTTYYYVKSLINKNSYQLRGGNEVLLNAQLNFIWATTMAGVFFIWNVALIFW